MKFSKIKAILSVLALTVVLTSVSYSQSSVGLGIESGLNMGDISATPTFQTSGRTGFMVGGFADIGFTNIVGIRPGVRFVTKGFSTTFNGVTYTDKLSYLEFPLLLKVTFPTTTVKPYVMAGPTLGIQLSANTDISVQGGQNQTADASTAYETIDFGLYFGGGMDFHVANNTDMFTGIGYALGLTNTSKVQGVSTKNYGIQFTAGVKFHL